ncbi:hypothetical protein KKG65_00285 [Patescibacteria group bacterium]|nr:hypothetical protein [Patescibacteria group bacterium]
MRKEKITCLLGCGQKGREWAGQQKGGLTLCLDQDIDCFGALHLESPDLIIGSALLLPLGKGSVNKIHADFLLNAVFHC